jgi:hypothetical protein
VFGFPGQTGAEVHRASTKLFVVPAGTLPVPDRLYSLFLRHLPALRCRNTTTLLKSAAEVPGAIGGSWRWQRRRPELRARSF